MLKIGLDRTDITPDENVPLIGYGDRTHNSVGIHDSLYAYVLYLEPGRGSPVVWIIADLCLFSVASVKKITAQLSENTGIDTGAIFIQTTHTHSGPDTFNITGNAAPWAKRYLQKLLSNLTACIKSVVSNSFPGKIEVREGRSLLGQNRRDAEGIIDPRITLLSLVDEQGQERGLLFHYSCHLTVLGVENYLISADWAGPARDMIEKETGHPACFIQGAEGNIDPKFRGVLDMADPDQAKGSSFSVVEEAGTIMAEAVLTARKSSPGKVLETLSQRTTSMQLPLRYGGLSEDQITAKLLEWKRKFADFLHIPVEEVTEDPVINALIKEQCRKLNLSKQETRKIVAEQFSYIQFIWAYKFGGEFIDQHKGTVSCDITEIDFNALKFIGIPAEVLVEISLEFQAENPDKTALIAGLFGGTFGYMPHSSNFKEENADSLYETISTIFGETASRVILKEF